MHEKLIHVSSDGSATIGTDDSEIAIDALTRGLCLILSRYIELIDHPKQFRRHNRPSHVR